MCDLKALEFVLNSIVLKIYELDSENNIHFVNIYYL